MSFYYNGLIYKKDRQAPCALRYTGGPQKEKTCIEGKADYTNDNRYQYCDYGNSMEGD